MNCRWVLLSAVLLSACEPRPVPPGTPTVQGTVTLVHRRHPSPLAERRQAYPAIDIAVKLDDGRKIGIVCNDHFSSIQQYAPCIPLEVNDRVKVSWRGEYPSGWVLR